MCRCPKMGDSHNMFDKNPSGEENPEVIAVNDEEDNVGEEYESINHTLDQLETCLEALEQQNDSLFSKLQALLDETTPPEEMDSESTNISTEVDSEKRNDSAPLDSAANLPQDESQPS